MDVESADQGSSSSSRFQDKETPIIEIISAQIADTEGTDKKYVLYTLQIRHIESVTDPKPAILERRYTDFHNLYLSLTNRHPKLMSSVTFPRKVLMGNFDNTVISTRSTGFESFLKHVVTERTLRYSTALLHFLQDRELVKTKQLIAERQYAVAVPLLENNFRLLNKIYTDRTAAVLLALCRLLGCSVLLPGSPNAEQWADIALHRYDGVCDSDLLELYLPLLIVCSKVQWQVGKYNEILEHRIRNLIQQGIKLDESITLLEAVDKLEAKLKENSRLAL